MENFWKWLQRIATITAIVSFVKSGDMKDTIIFIKQFWNNLSAWQFIFFLSITVLFIRFVSFLLSIKKSLGKKISSDVIASLKEFNKLTPEEYEKYQSYLNNKTVKQIRRLKFKNKFLSIFRHHNILWF